MMPISRSPPGRVGCGCTINNSSSAGSLPGICARAVARAAAAACCMHEYWVVCWVLLSPVVYYHLDVGCCLHTRSMIAHHKKYQVRERTYVRHSEHTCLVPHRFSPRLGKFVFSRIHFIQIRAFCRNRKK